MTQFKSPHSGSLDVKLIDGSIKITYDLRPLLTISPIVVPKVLSFFDSSLRSRRLIIKMEEKTPQWRLRDVSGHNRMECINQEWYSPGPTNEAITIIGVTFTCLSSCFRIILWIQEECRDRIEKTGPWRLLRDVGSRARQTSRRTISTVCTLVSFEVSSPKFVLTRNFLFRPKGVRLCPSFLTRSSSVTVITLQFLPSTMYET